jgi:F0F1-type ATP synthase assembly protein I
MKYLQISFLKITLYSTLFFSQSLCYAQNEKIRVADSLFKAKQYTQSLEIYQSVFTEKKYTPAMLLRMAYINEGLGKTGATLFFLKLYYLASNDDQTTRKTEDLAAKFNLKGYEENDSGRLLHWFVSNSTIIRVILALILLGIATAIFAQRKQSQKPWALLVTFVLLTSLLVYSNNIYTHESVVVTSDNTYLMDGPSAGANVASVISEGTLLQLLGHEDVWLRVKWTDKEVFLKEKNARKVAL